MKYFMITFVALAACISTAFTASHHQRGGHYKYADNYGSRPPSNYGDDYGYNHGNYYGYGYKRIVCEKLEDPENGSVKQRGIYKGAKAVYSCDVGHTLRGQKVRVCSRSGKFSGEPPICEPVDCGPLSNPENGRVVTEPDTTLNSVATYACKRGFKLVGDEQRSCQTDGNWSGETPVCQKIRCPKLRAPKYGKVFVSGYYPGDHARYRCAYGYSLHGDKHRRVCQYSGVWSGSDIECKKIQHQYGYGGYGKYNGY